MINHSSGIISYYTLIFQKTNLLSRTPLYGLNLPVMQEKKIMQRNNKDTEPSEGSGTYG
jgi:hypothetical protein